MSETGNPIEFCSHMPAPTTSTTLLRRAGQGDSDAIALLLRELDPRLRRRLAPELPHRFQSVLDIDDVLQETYTDVFLDVAEFCPRGPDSFERWVTLIARNNLRNAIRSLEAQKRGGDRLRVVAPSLEDSYASLLSVLSGSGSTPSKATTAAEMRGTLDAAIAGLPEVYRTVVREFDLAGRSAAELAAFLGRSQGAVFMVRSRAHRLLRSILAGNGQGFSDLA